MTQPQPIWVPRGPRPGEPVRVYIAATVAYIDLVRDAEVQIRSANLEVVSTWHHSEDDLELASRRRYGRPQESVAHTGQAQRCIAELERSNTLLWMFGNRNFSCGEDTWELGWAFARGRMLALVPVVRPMYGYPVFAALMPRYESVDAWLKELKPNG